MQQIPLRLSLSYFSRSRCTDAATDTYSDPIGVTIRANASLPLLTDPNVSDLPEYFCEAQLLEQAGYRPELDYASVAYDWRKGPSDWSQPGGYFSQLKSGIEQLRARAGKPVVAVSFSLGGPVFAIFLNKYVTEAWKDENIARWLSLSGTFGGVQMSLLQQLTFQGAFSIPTMDNQTSLDMMRSWGSQNWMAASLPPDQVVV